MTPSKLETAKARERFNKDLAKKGITTQSFNELVLKAAVHIEQFGLAVVDVKTPRNRYHKGYEDMYKALEKVFPYMYDDVWGVINQEEPSEVKDTTVLNPVLQCVQAFKEQPYKDDKPLPFPEIEEEVLCGVEEPLLSDEIPFEDDSAENDISEFLYLLNSLSLPKEGMIKWSGSEFTYVDLTVKKDEKKKKKKKKKKKNKTLHIKID